MLDAVSKGQISLERTVALAATEPARAFGLAGTKGRIEVGLDADLVVADLHSLWTITEDSVLSRSDWTPYDGRTLTGRIETTLVRGAEVFAEGKVVGQPGQGRQARADGTGGNGE
jgi:dihydroorotase